MSVLLDALKRAAQEKQKKAELKDVSTPVLDSTASSNVSEPLTLNLRQGIHPSEIAQPELQPDSDTAEQEVNLNLVSGLEPLQKAENIIVSEPTNLTIEPVLKSEEQLSVSVDLNLADSDSNEDSVTSDDAGGIAQHPKEKSSEQPALDVALKMVNLQDTDPSGSAKLDLDSQLAAKENSETNRYQAPTNVMPTLEDDDELIIEKRNITDEASGNIPLKFSTSIETSSDNLPSESEETPLVEPETKTRQEDEPSHILTPQSQEIEVKDITSNANEADKEIVKDDGTESVSENDWSLNQIPGYQQYGAHQEAQKQTDTLLKFMQPKKERHFSKWATSLLVAVVPLLGFGYYGLIYFEEQSQLVEREMKQYQLPRVSPKPLIANDSIKNPIESVDVASKAMEKTPPLDPKQAKESVVKSGQPSVKKETATIASKPPALKSVPAKLTPRKETQPARRPSKVAKTLPTKSKPHLHISSVEKISYEEKGYQAYQAGDLNSAQKYYQQALQEDAKSLPALFGLGAVATKRGETRVALSHYKQALKVSPYNADAKKAVAALEVSTLDNPEQVSHLKDLIAQYPDSPKLYVALGSVYAKSNDWVQAQKYFFKAYQQDSSSTQAVMNLAISLDRLGKYALARKYYAETLSKLAPESNVVNRQKIQQRMLVLNRFLVQVN